jgi:hypothetical protein
LQFEKVKTKVIKKLFNSDFMPRDRKTKKGQLYFERELLHGNAYNFTARPPW